MEAATFAQRLDAAIVASGSLLCVGLDPDIAQVGDLRGAERLCHQLLDEALPHAAAVKPNSGFFEQFGSAGMALLETIRARVPADRILVLDGKRGDIGNTAAAYARAAFDVLGADAVTVNPLMGEDAVRPFLDRPGRGAFVLTRTSNPGAADLLEREVEGVPLYRRIAELALGWDPGGAVGLVAGATAPEALAALRSLAPDAPFLVPGVGPQGGAVEAAVAAGADARGRGMVVNVSRGISAAPEGPAAAARAWRERLDTARVAGRRA